MENKPHEEHASLSEQQRRMDRVYNSRPMVRLFATLALLMLATTSSEPILDRNEATAEVAAREVITIATTPVPYLVDTPEAIIFTPTAESTPEAPTFADDYRALQEVIATQFEISKIPEGMKDLFNTAVFLDVLTHGARPVETYTQSELVKLMEETIGIDTSNESALVKHILEDKGQDNYQCVDAFMFLGYRESDTGVNTLPFLKNGGGNAKAVFDNITREYREQSKKPENKGYNSFYLEGFEGKVIYIGYELPTLSEMESGQLWVIRGGDKDPGHMFFVVAIDKESGQALLYNGNFDLDSQPVLDGKFNIKIYDESQLAQLWQENGATPAGVIGLEIVE